MLGPRPRQETPQLEQCHSCYIDPSHRSRFIWHSRQEMWKLVKPTCRLRKTINKMSITHYSYLQSQEIKLASLTVSHLSQCSWKQARQFQLIFSFSFLYYLLPNISFFSFSYCQRALNCIGSLAAFKTAKCSPKIIPQASWALTLITSSLDH